MDEASRAAETAVDETVYGPASSIRSLAGPAWSAVWKAGDARALADFYADDAVVFPNGASPLTGRDAIRAAFQAFFENATIAGSSEIQELEIAGEWAFLRGTYTTSVTPKSSGVLENDAGHWLWIVKRQPSGEWKIFRAMGASLPPEPAVAEA